MQRKTRQQCETDDSDTSLSSSDGLIPTPRSSAMPQINTEDGILGTISDQNVDDSLSNGASPDRENIMSYPTPAIPPTNAPCISASQIPMQDVEPFMPNEGRTFKSNVSAEIADNSPVFTFSDVGSVTIFCRTDVLNMKTFTNCGLPCATIQSITFDPSPCLCRMRKSFMCGIRIRISSEIHWDVCIF